MAQLPWIREPSLPVADTADLDRLTGYRGSDRPGPPPLTPDTIRAFLQSAASLSKFGDELDTLDMNPLHFLLMLVDRDSGSSLLHAIVAAGNLDGLLGIQNTFSPNLGSRQGDLRAIHIFLTHQDKAGDTAMHVAVRTGRLDMVKNLYRLFTHRALENDELCAPLEGKDAPENWVIAESMRHLARQPLLFLCAKNAAGRDAVQEARNSGHEEIATFLERIIAGLDPKGRRLDGSEVKRMERQLRRRFHFLNSEGLQEPESEEE
ncbi:hypothetical protein S7711_11273 [Stachybotrys chartarum IBT 7711]|uniref:Uncharacterized protein n=1 Tax=Stachybotrys chartarum (strain CBS 109288 / IBT 7711) TaxID=1280523 RepID=A0A084BAD1_STACB|nr:hypothetical protein S7711_11273 [Stachybotrys chartarum IBT 7711]KFA54665.1 hypothetical protein S40293_10606 [Stachybotrys chartarum IBT 40293]